ncbi:aspartate 1-decarboxylase [Alicyclobacillus contaminans]|uniref:aspartate 1-decarboxylase n=1 Tax=Alicyclobacillus contaminans TaxID=392016 RepID=UPI00040B08C2|nr:aspartate 1-decarboxylase [Alicyclobacillus contaminans]
MLRQVCKGKIHRATVTQADLNYMGSITLDSHLMRAANIWPFEMVQITNLSNGVIWHTYALEGAAGSGTVCLNGPPARHFQPGDLVIILSLAYVTAEEWKTLKPSVVFVDQRNIITSVVQHPMSDAPGALSPD